MTDQGLVGPLLACSHVDEGREGGFGEAGDVAGANLESSLGPEFRRWLMVMLSVGAEFEGMDVQGEAGVGQQSPQAGQIEVPGYLLPEHSNNPDPAISIIQQKRAEAQRPNARDVVSNNGCFSNGAFIIPLEYNRRNNHGSSYPPVMTIMRLFIYAKWVPRDTNGIRHLTGLPFQALVERS